MKNAITRSVGCLALAVAALTAFGASAAPINIGFDSDPAPVNVSNGFTSSDSSEVHFSDTNELLEPNGENLIVLEVDGSNALATL